MTKKILPLFVLGTLLATGCTQQITQDLPAKTETKQATSAQKTSLEILPAGGTMEQTNSPVITKISSGSSFRFSPKIYGNYVTWEQSATNQQEYMDIYLYDLTTKQAQRLGMSKELFGNTVNGGKDDFTSHDQYVRGAASFNDRFVVWNELNPSGDASDSGIYYSSLGGKADKKLIEKNVYLSTSPVNYRLDGDKFYYFANNQENSGYSVFDLVQGKQLSKVPAQETDKKFVQEDLKELYQNSSAYKAGGLPDPSNILGFGRSGDYLAWETISSKDQKKNGVFVMNLKTGSVTDILEKSTIRFASDYGSEMDPQFMISGNKVVFRGYEGTLKEDYSNVDIYVASL